MDDGSSIALMIAAMLLLCAMSAFFSAAETAYSSLNQIRLKSRADSGDEGAARVLALAQRYDSLLSTILIGNNIVNIALASLGTVLFTDYVSRQSGPALSTLVVTLVVLIFGEVTPKSLAKEMPEKYAQIAAPVLSMLIWVLTPANWLFGLWKSFLAKHFHTEDSEGITDAELMTMVTEAESGGDLTDRESELIRSAIEFDDVEVEQVLTPRVDVEAVPDTITPDELAEAFAESGYSRLPVYHETIDNIIGVIHEKDYYSALRKSEDDIDIEALIAPTIYTTASTQISQLLGALREKHHHLAVVVDEYGGTEGIVTLEDILEELVGEIWDEHDEEIEEFRRQADGRWLIAGSAAVEDLYEELSIPEEPDLDAVTVSGLVQEKTGRLPKVGDRFEIGRYDGVVTKTRQRRVVEVCLHERPAPQPDQKPAAHAPRGRSNSH